MPQSSPIKQLFYAIWRNDLTDIEELLRDGKVGKEECYDAGFDDTSLEYVVSFGSVQAFQLFRKYGWWKDAADLERASLLYRAIFRTPGPNDMVSALLEHGVSPDAPCHVKSKAWSSNYPPLSICVSKNNSSLALLLLEHGADPEVHTQHDNAKDKAAIICVRKALKLRQSAWL